MNRTLKEQHLFEMEIFCNIKDNIYCYVIYNAY